MYLGDLYMTYRDVMTYVKQNIIDNEIYEKIVGKYKNARCF